MTETKPLPLKMGDKTVGHIVLDYKTGSITGALNKEVIKLLEDILGAGLLEVSFFGKPAISASVAQRIFNDYVQEVEPGSSCRIPGHRQRVNNDGRTFHCLDCEQIIIY